MVPCFVSSPVAVASGAIETNCSKFVGQMGEAHAILCGLFSFSRANDGIVYMSSSIVLLLICRYRYDIEKYISIRQEIRRSGEAYYEMLATNSSGLREDESEPVLFIKCMLGVVVVCCGKLGGGFSILTMSAGNERSVKMLFDKLVRMVMRRKVLDTNSGTSRRTLDRIHVKYPD